ncbi:MAG TPA: adenylate/guanylate cyclase domain-containing protein [Actinomycetales bacterium]|nr:adenylate/guanylate cyclase domain-containing protein [Actinomycetales bacterium]
MTCAACGFTGLRPEDRFCSRCGAARRAPSCARCGTELRPGASFCSSCGFPVGPGQADLPGAGTGRGAGPHSSERRLTSVLFADLVSYTTLAESRDTEDVRDLLSRYFEVCTTVVRRYGGRVEKFIGDAVMAVWGVPTAHEDDAERAVRAALELISGVAELAERTELPELAVRAGVVTGEVSATVGATDQGLVAGDPVNTASRVQSAARPGEVWVDASTRALTAAAISYSDVGVHQLKGKAEPVPLFRAGSVVAGVGGLRRVDGLEAPMTGRDRELRLVKELFHATGESGRPRLVVVDGEPGVGKSRLAWEFSKYVDGLSSEVMWHQGRCLSYGDGAAFWALAEAVRARLGLVEESTSDESADALERSLRHLVPDDDERGWLRPRLASLLGQDGNFRREDLFAAWARFFERLSEPDRTVVLVVDDAQYADDGLLDFLDDVATSARAPIFLLLLARPELLQRRPGLGGRRATLIDLEPLGDDAMRVLVSGLVDGLPPEATQQLVTRAEGVPLYAVETVRALVDRALVRVSNGRHVVSPDADLDLSRIEAPASLHALVAARLDALTAAERRIVADASVLGLSFTREAIEVLSGQRSDLDDVLGSLARKEVVATETDRFSAERGHYRFVQAVVRQVAYATLSRRDRKEKHLMVADHLAAQTERADELAVVIAQHLMDAVTASGPQDDDVPALQRRAGEVLAQAAARACCLGSFADGLRLFRSAASRLDDPTARAEVHAQAAEAALVRGDFDTALTLARQALVALESRGSGTGVAAAQAAATQADALMARGEVTAALDLLQPRHEALVNASGAEAARLRLLNSLVRLRMFSTPQDPETLRLAHDQVRLSEQLQDEQALAHSIHTLSTLEAILGCRTVSKALTHQALTMSTRLSDWRSIVIARGNQADILLPTSPHDAVQQGEEALAVAAAHGLRAFAEGVSSNLAVALWVHGSWDRLDSLLTEVMEAGLHDPSSMTSFMAVDLWRVDAGLPARVPQQPMAPTEQPQEQAWQRHVEMERALLAGDLTAAASLASQVLGEALTPSVTRGDISVLWPRSMRAALTAGDLELAGRLLQLVSDLPPGDVTPALRAHLLLLRGELGIAQGADDAQVHDDLAAAVAAFEAYGSPPQLARAQGRHGRWLLGQGRTTEAEPLLAAAWGTLSQLGATAWLEEMSGLLPATAAPTS